MNFELFWPLHNDVTQLSVYLIISWGFNLEVLNKDSWESFLQVTVIPFTLIGYVEPCGVKLIRTVVY